MARYVREIMNPEVFSVTPDQPISELEDLINTLEITAVPVVDDRGFAVGMLSLRDLHRGDGTTAEDRMNAPAVVLEAAATIEAGARLLSETGLHRLVVVDERFKVVGIVSAVDFVRGLIGVPAKFPVAFPHIDRDTGLIWSDDSPLELDRVLEAAPDAPGVLALVHGGPNIPETIVWTEGTENLASRLIDIVSTPQAAPISTILNWEHVRFRIAEVADVEQRAEALDAVRNRPLPTQR